jgi:hypothetical protein
MWDYSQQSPPSHCEPRFFWECTKPTLLWYQLLEPDRRHIACPSDRSHTRRAHPGRRATTHALARIAVGFRSLGPTLPQKASPLGGCTLNHMNYACSSTTHNMRLFPTISPSHCEPRFFWEYTGPTWFWYQLLEPDRRHIACPSDRPHTRRVHPGHRAATHAPACIAAGFSFFGPTLPQKASSLGGCTLNHINHACSSITHNVGLFPICVVWML